MYFRGKIFLNKYKNKVTYVIVTFNEQDNIASCIDSIRLFDPIAEIKVYDGGSNDDTVNIARSKFVKVYEYPNTSLAYRRQLGADHTDTQFIFYVDADHRIGELKISIKNVLIKYFAQSSKAGIMFRKHCLDSNYWGTGFFVRGDLFIYKNPNPKVIGMPCIFRNDLVKEVGFDLTADGSIDDTTLCLGIIKRGYKLSIADEYVTEKFRSSFLSTVSKAYWYGLGDAEFIKKFSGKTVYNHVYHIFIRQLGIHPIISMISRPRFLPFFLSFGLARCFGTIRGLIKLPDLKLTKS